MSDIALFGEFLAREKGAESFEEADEDCAVVWLGEQSNLGAASQARRLSALKSFGSHMCDVGLWPKNYASAAVRPKFRRGVPQTLTPLEIGALIESAEGDSFERLRDAAMLELMYGSGLRVSEICSLKAADVDLREGVLRVRGKGGDTRPHGWNTLSGGVSRGDKIFVRSGVYRCRRGAYAYSGYGIFACAVVPGFRVGSEH